MSEYGEIEAVLDEDGETHGITVLVDGEEYLLEDPCDEDGCDWYDDDPPAYKMVETSYKGREDGSLICLIQELGRHPKAKYFSGRDEDGDHYWRAVFLLKDCPNWRPRASEG